MAEELPDHQTNIPLTNECKTKLLKEVIPHKSCKLTLLGQVIKVFHSPFDKGCNTNKISCSLQSSLNGSTSNLPDGTGRSFATSFSGQSGAASPVFHHSGGVQQPTGTLSSGRFASNNLPVALSQLSHGSSHGHSGVTSRGGLGVSPILGNAGPRITSSMGNMVSGGNIGRSVTAGGGLSLPGLASRLNLNSNSGSGSLTVQGQNRLISGVLPQGSQQVLSMLGNSYPSAGGPLSQNHMQSVNSLNSLGMLNDVNANDNSPFDINDFPQLTSRPSSAGGPQGQLSSLRKQGLSPIVQQNQEFSIQNEDFPALPRFKGGNADYGMDIHQKDQHENSVPMMQSQQFSIGRSAGFNLGGTFSHRPQQQQQHSSAVSNSTVSFPPANNQDLLHLHGSDIFPSSHAASYHQQSSGPPGIGLRPLSSPNSASGMGYDQLQQYQQHHGQSQFRLQHMSGVSQSFRDQGIKSMQAAQSSPDPFGLLGLLSVIRLSDPDLASLALGIDLTTLGLNLNSADNLHKTFGSPWSDEPAKGDPDFNVPQCYLIKPPASLHQGYFPKFSLETLFYIFFSMPKDEAQLYAANELYNRGWFYHKEHRFWFIRVSNMEPLVKTSTYERGSYLCFDPHTFETVRKDNFVLHYEMVEKRPVLSQH
ncbi:probable NOT transcription complex subunit VIP2 isoform X7 [Cucumis melo]|uniref:Probable NOT transcription complex subunit VIP2 isoform X7 n=1 Tax=Cucumis melo TaxID=3656 RepID=A0ABM3LBW0_CUCME|nr:probable NOT transcription complex subunit VIP2 isoform X7 [Cucumis melo]